MTVLGNIFKLMEVDCTKIEERIADYIKFGQFLGYILLMLVVCYWNSGIASLRNYWIRRE